jgi:hypothetical protein
MRQVRALQWLWWLICFCRLSDYKAFVGLV